MVNGLTWGWAAPLIAIEMESHCECLQFLHLKDLLFFFFSQYNIPCLSLSGLLFKTC